MRRPTVLQIDDLQWLDPESSEFLYFLTRNIDNYPITVITTSRYQDDGSYVPLELNEGIGRLDIDLGCLERSDASSLAQDVLQDPVSAELVDFLVEKSGGNPFFTEQLLLDLRERKALRADHSGALTISKRDTLEIPRTIGAVLVARIDRLAAEIRAIVQTAAVLGQEFEIQVLSEMLKAEPDVQTIVKRAEGEAIWSSLSELRYIFRHALLRDAAYDMQLRARLRHLHELAAEAIETVFAKDLAPYYPDLAFHFQKAEKTEPERHYAQQAGVQARDRSSFREAIGFLERALSLSSDTETSRRCDILRVLGDVYLSIGDYERADERLQHALAAVRQSDDQVGEAHVTEALASVAYRRGDVESARTGYERSLAAYQASEEDEGIATSLLHLGLVHQRLGDIDRALELFQESRTLSEQLDHRRSLAVSMNALGELALRRGRYAEAREIFERCIAICREIEDPMRTALALNNLGTAASEMGEPEAAHEFYTEALQIQREIGDAYGSAATLNNLAFFPYSSGDFQAAEQLVKESLKIAREIGNLHISAMNLNNLGMFAELQNDFAKAKDRFEESLEISRKLGDPQGIALTLCSLASTLLELGEEGQAEATLTESLELATNAQATPLMLQALLRIGELYLLRGHAPRGAELVGLVDHHPATEADVRQNIVPRIRGKLEASMAPDEFAQLFHRGKLSDLSTVVETILGKGLDC
jgi:predicted ATPase